MSCNGQSSGWVNISSIGWTPAEEEAVGPNAKVTAVHFIYAMSHVVGAHPSKTSRCCIDAASRNLLQFLQKNGIVAGATENYLLVFVSFVFAVVVFFSRRAPAGSQKLPREDET